MSSGLNWQPRQPGTGGLLTDPSTCQPLPGPECVLELSLYQIDVSGLENGIAPGKSHPMQPTPTLSHPLTPTVFSFKHLSTGHSAPAPQTCTQTVSSTRLHRPLLEPYLPRFLPKHLRGHLQLRKIPSFYRPRHHQAVIGVPSAQRPQHPSSNTHLLPPVSHPHTCVYAQTVQPYPSAAQILQPLPLPTWASPSSIWAVRAAHASPLCPQASARAECSWSSPKPELQLQNGTPRPLLSEARPGSLLSCWHTQSRLTPRACIQDLGPLPACRSCAVPALQMRICVSHSVLQPT